MRMKNILSKIVKKTTRQPQFDIFRISKALKAVEGICRNITDY